MKRWHKQMAGTVVILAVVVVIGATLHAEPAGPSGEFSRTTIDVGTVVSDVEKAVEFYTKAIGFTEASGFSVPGDFCADAGLTNGKPLSVRVLVLGKGPQATKLKLMTVPGVNSKSSDNTHIHSQLGYSYLTIFVQDTNRALERLKQAGVKPVAKGPIAVPGGGDNPIYLTIVRDPDGNLIELLGPRK